MPILSSPALLQSSRADPAAGDTGLKPTTHSTKVGFSRRRKIDDDRDKTHFPREVRTTPAKLPQRAGMQIFPESVESSVIKGAEGATGF